MKTPFITINLSKIKKNAKQIVSMCKKYNIQVCGVSKVVCGDPYVMRNMMEGGVEEIGETRIENIQNINKLRSNCPTLLIRSPSLSNTSEVVKYFTSSLNSEYEVVKALSIEAKKINKNHNIIIMVDLGDLREGLMPNDVIPFIKEVKKLDGIKIEGLGTNFLDLNGVIPTKENNDQFAEIAIEAENKCNLHFNILSAGNSGSIKLMNKGLLNSRINHFRLGESILLGIDALDREEIKGTYQDVFSLYAEVIEVKVKPSLPIGERAKNAFNELSKIEDTGLETRAILNIGRQDVDINGLSLKKTFGTILGASSDHLVISTNKSCKVGDVIGFNLNYSALLAAMTSKYIKKYYKK